MLKRLSLFRQTLYISRFEALSFWKRGLMALERMLRASSSNQSSLTLLVLGSYGVGKSTLIKGFSPSLIFHGASKKEENKSTHYPSLLESLNAQGPNNLRLTSSSNHSPFFCTNTSTAQWTLYTSIIEGPGFGSREISSHNLTETLLTSQADLCLFLLHPNYEDSEAEEALIKALMLFLKKTPSPPLIAFLNATDLRHTRLALDQTDEEKRQLQRIKKHLPSLKWLGSGSAYFASLAHQGLQEIEKQGALQNEDLIEALEHACKRMKIISRKTSFPSTIKEQNLEYCTSLLQKSGLFLLNQIIYTELKDQIDEKRQTFLWQTSPLTSSWFLCSDQFQLPYSDSN